jgi:DNA-directed RNA polymerase specialized sigma24 family protein
MQTETDISADGFRAAIAMGAAAAKAEADRIVTILFDERMRMATSIRRDLCLPFDQNEEIASQIMVAICERLHFLATAPEGRRQLGGIANLRNWLFGAARNVILVDDQHSDRLAAGPSVCRDETKIRRIISTLEARGEQATEAAIIEVFNEGIRVDGHTALLTSERVRIRPQASRRIVDGEDFASTAPAPDAYVDAQSTRATVREMVEDVLAEVEAGPAEVFRRHFLGDEEEPYPVIARALGKPLSTVKSWGKRVQSAVAERAQQMRVAGAL